VEGDRVMDAFAARLRTDRNQIGLIVRQLADQTGISFSYITKIETGRAGRGISPAIVTTLAESLQSDVLEYLSLSNVVPSPLDQLIADKRSREFLRRLLSLKVSASGWDRLQGVLAESTENYRTTNRETPIRFKKPKGKTAEQKALEVGSGE
jgi:HTH-type transcriptional regulator, competence development regulator